MDLIIRNGLIVDGTGAEPLEADIAIRGGRIAEVGRSTATGAKEIDARGHIVTPGFVDIHTHYDGHVTWENHLRPSNDHGVTTVITGNCGVGFAPCRPEDRADLLDLMEGVEDIPEPVMTTGLPWNWQTFPEFLDAVGVRQFDMDVAMQLPHAPLRIYVMGQRGIDREDATAEDIASMAAIAKEAIMAGAIGFSTTRGMYHRFLDGRMAPCFTSAEEELTGIAMALGAANAGVLQLITDFDDHDSEFDMLERIAQKSNRPLSMSLMQRAGAPKQYAHTLGRIAAANRKGIEMRAQVSSRPGMGLFGLSMKVNAFSFCPSYKMIEHLPLGERVKAMRDEEMRARLLTEFPPHGQSNDMTFSAAIDIERQHELAARDPDYEPPVSTTVGAVARKLGISPAEYMYGRLLADDGKTLFGYTASGWVEGSIDAQASMMTHPYAVQGLGDGGAHCGLVCDASQQTYMLTRWAKGRHGRSLPLQTVVRMISRDPAAAVGLHDRGLIKPGYKADLNVIDFDRLSLHRPEMVYDLPSGGGRLIQKSDGYRATVVSGVTTRIDGEPTGELPGRLVRGQQRQPTM